MSETAQLVETLKRVLREKKITYLMVAEHLGLSEANVKRMFSRRHFTLSRMEEICNLAEVDLGYLMMRMQEDSQLLNSLSYETEAELIQNEKLLIMAQLLINRWSFKEILKTYDFEELEGIQLLAKLDRMGIIDLLAGNRVKTLVSRHFNWIKDGPVQNYFKRYVALEFFDCNFDVSAGELLVFSYGQITRQANAQLQNSMLRLAREFDEACKEGSKQPLSDTYGTGLTLAMRPWELSVFTKYRRAPNTKKF
jgi:DNA-binding Xre family transcriptional regulator